jgi:ubiquinone/menaquinone biosynthesis C-methylase UbiE
VTKRQNDASIVQSQFGAVAAAYATSTVHSGGPDLEALIQAANPGGIEDVLDLGCGAGHTAIALAGRVRSVMAVDLTSEMIEVAKRLAKERGLTNLTFRQADATALPFANGSFELVTSRYSAHHYSDPLVALGEVRRVLRPNGRFLLVDTVSPEDPALDTFYNAVELLRDASHVRNCRISEWERLFRAAWLEPEVLFRYPLVLDGESWVTRMRTPAPRVAALRELFTTASEAARQTFAIQDGPQWGWTIPVALISGTPR